MVSDLQYKGFSVVVQINNGEPKLIDTKTTQMVSDKSFSSVNIENGWSFDYSKVGYSGGVLTIDLRS